MDMLDRLRAVPARLTLLVERVLRDACANTVPPASVLCFDGSNYRSDPDDSPEPPLRSRRERVLSRLFLLTALVLLVLPVSLSTTVDVIRLLLGR